MSSMPRLIVKQTEPTELAEKCTKLYCGLIPNLYNVECPNFLADVKLALKDMRRLKYDANFQHKREFYIDIKYEEAAVRCAYLYAYSVLNTAIVYHEFSKYLNDEENIIPIPFLPQENIKKKKTFKKTLKICCLAGGPGTEAVGIIKAVSDFFSDSTSEFFTHAEVTVIDIVSEWETEGEFLIKELNEGTNFFNSRRIHFHYNFLKADLLSSFSESVKVSIAEADIITVVKFGSSLEEKSPSIWVSYLANMTKNVIDCMHENSCLFMLDVAGGKIFRNTMDVVSSRPNECLLVVSYHKKYRLLPKTLQKMESCINFRNVAKAATVFPTVFTTVSSCFWIKKSINPHEENSNTAND